MSIEPMGTFLAAWLVAAAVSPPTLQVEGNRLYVTAEINGSKTQALLDSGAEMTLMDTGFAEQLSLVASGSETARGTGGTAEVQFVENVDIEAAGVRLAGKTVVVLDLADISERVVGKRVNVIIGRELFDAGRFHLDIERGKFLKIEDGQDPEGIRLPLADHKGIKQMPITLEGLEEIQADFDLGNGNEVLIGRAYAADNGLLAEGRIVGTKEGGGIGGPVTRDLVTLESITVAGVPFHDVTAAIDPTDDAPPANVGVSLLRNFVITIDFPANAVWLVPNEPVE